MARTQLVKVCRPVFPPDGPWRVFDQKQEHEDTEVDPQDIRTAGPYLNPAEFRKIMSGRYIAYFMATWSIDQGWIFKRWIRKDYHWFDQEGNEI